MRQFGRFIFVIIFSSVLLHSGSSAKENWQPYAKTEDYSSFYDLNSVQYSCEGFVKVLVKVTALTDKGKEKRIRSIKKRKLSTAGYENYLYTCELLEIDCKKKKIRSLLFRDYNSKGEVLNEVIKSEKAMRWVSIPSRSPGETLYKTLCLQR